MYLFQNLRSSCCIANLELRDAVLQDEMFIQTSGTCATKQRQCTEEFHT